MPSVTSLFNKPRVQSRSSSPQRGIKSFISAPIPTDSVVQTSKPIHINGHPNMAYYGGEDDKDTLRAPASTHADQEVGPVSASEASPQDSSPVRSSEGAVEMSRHGNESSATTGYDVSSPSSGRKRSLSRSEDQHGGGATDEASLRSVPVLYTNMVPEGELDGISGNHSQTDVSRKVSVKRSPSKLVKRRGTKGKQTDSLVNGNESRRSASRNSQRSFRSNRGPVFDMVTAPPNATLSDVGGAFRTGAVMAAPENEVEDELRSGLHERITIAESALTEKQAKRIHKEELAVSKRISKIVESEGKSEKNSLQAAIDELKDIQKMQRVAVKDESSIHASHVKSLQKCHEMDIAVITARAELEKVEAEISARLAKVQAELNKLRVKAQGKVDRAVAEAEKAKADVRAREHHREASRRHSEQMTGWVRDKRKEVEVLRSWKAVDDREREAKLNELKGVRRSTN